MVKSKKTCKVHEIFTVERCFIVNFRSMRNALTITCGNQLQSRPPDTYCNHQSQLANIHQMGKNQSNLQTHSSVVQRVVIVSGSLDCGLRVIA